MSPIHRIVVGVDFDECSERAVDHAIELARALEANVAVVHSYELPMYWGFPTGAIVATADMAERIVEAAKAGLQSIAEKRKRAGVELSTVLRNGAAAEQVGAAAQELGADLIVVGSHGRRGLSHAFLGSVAERIVRTASRPVLVVRSPPEVPAQGSAVKPVRRIVVATDFSAIADHALDYAIALAGALEAGIAVVHSYGAVTYRDLPEGSAVNATAQMMGHVEVAVQSALRSMADKGKRAGVELSTIQRSGAPADEVTAAATELGADLIVIGSQGRRGFSRALLGSVAERVVRTATCPVLVVRPRPKS
jgi:nucleotide-binding universal stress UspA family protein